MRIQEIVIEVSGMANSGCEIAISDVLMALQGVQAVQVDSRQGRVVVTGDPSLARPDVLAAAITRAGYDPGEVWFAE